MHAAKSGNIGRIFVALVIVAVMFGFSPIATRLLHLVGGSFKPTHYSSLGFVSPSAVAAGVDVGTEIRVKLTNHSGSATTYKLLATENGTLISQGSRAVANGLSETLYVSTQGATHGTLKIALEHTKIFITVRLLSTNP